MVAMPYHHRTCAGLLLRYATGNGQPSLQRRQLHMLLWKAGLRWLPACCGGQMEIRHCCLCRRKQPLWQQRHSDQASWHNVSLSGLCLRQGMCCSAGLLRCLQLCSAEQV